MFSIDRDETIRQQAARAIMVFAVTVFVLMYLGSIYYTMNPLTVVLLSAFCGYLIWELAPTWAVVVFDWLLFVALLVGAIGAICVFPVQSAALSVVGLAVWRIFRK